MPDLDRNLWICIKVSKYFYLEMSNYWDWQRNWTFKGGGVAQTCEFDYILLRRRNCSLNFWVNFSLAIPYYPSSVLSVRTMPEYLKHILVVYICWGLVWFVWVFFFPSFCKLSQGLSHCPCALSPPGQVLAVGIVTLWLFFSSMVCSWAFNLSSDCQQETMK